jgi:YbgC/YbaW family acyl-CoA thioester hydrolase
LPLGADLFEYWPMFVLPVTVTEAHADNPYHHVHHTEILRFMEQARLEFMRAIGYPAEALISKNIYAIVGSIAIRYLREVRPGEHTVTCENGRLEGKSLYLTQKMYNARRKIVAQAEVECVLMDGITRRAVVPNAPLVEAFTAYNPPVSP